MEKSKFTKENLNNCKETFISFCRALPKLNKDYNSNPFDVVPYVVNLSYCVEIGFKYLLVKHIDDIDVGKLGHDLKSLYKKLMEVESLAPKLNDALIEHYIGYENKNYLYKQFDIISNNYITWRYCFEKKNVQTNIELLEALCIWYFKSVGYWPSEMLVNGLYFFFLL